MILEVSGEDNHEKREIHENLQNKPSPRIAWTGSPCEYDRQLVFSSSFLYSGFIDTGGQMNPQKHDQGTGFAGNWKLNLLSGNRSSISIFLGLLIILLTAACLFTSPKTSIIDEPEPTERTMEPPATETATISPTATLQPTQTQESECDRLNLTPQECENFGEHMYTLEGSVEGYCEYGRTDGTMGPTVTRDFRITVLFSEGQSGKVASIKNAVFINCDNAYESGVNTYVYDCISNGGNRDQGTITFLDNAILNDGGMSNSVNKNCTWTEVYQIH